MRDGYIYKTEPRPHQREAFELSRDREAYGLFFRMRRGKTKVIIDTAAYLWDLGRVTGLLVVCPNGTQRVWAEQLPVHLPDRVARVAVQYRAGRKRAPHDVEALYRPGTALRVLAINYEAVLTKEGRKQVERFLNTFRTLLVADESQRCKTPGIRRSKVLRALRKRAPYRRILSGTPVTEAPLDLWSQFSLLGDELLGWRTYSGFKHHYAEWERRYTSNNRQGYYEQVKQGDDGRPCWMHLDELQARVREHAYVLLNREGLPAKEYNTVYTELSPAQRRVYEQLAAEGAVRLGEEHRERLREETGDSWSTAGTDLWNLMVDPHGLVRSKNAMTLFMRLQQVLGNHVTDETGASRRVGDDNPRLRTLIQVVTDIEERAIIWARFRAELDELERALDEQWSGQVVAYHGGVVERERDEALTRFRAGDARLLVGNPSSGVGRGQDLSCCSAMVYYSKDFSYETRAQSEERTATEGKDEPTLIYDIVAEGTVDERVTQALIAKQEMSEEVMGERVA